MQGRSAKSAKRAPPRDTRGGGKALARLRRLCLGLPETSEAGSWGHPNFRAGKKTFAAFEWIQGRPSIAVRLDAAAVDYLRSRHKNFFLTPYGRGVWASAWADRPIDWALVEELVERAYRKVALRRMLAALDVTA
jgi:predicted DNA-binding protein (MmcQ/YjbR family)